MKGNCPSKVNKILKAMGMPATKFKQEESKIIQKLCTLELFEYMQVQFTKSVTDKQVNLFVSEMKKREDLFPAFLDFTERISKFYNDLYYWKPGLAISDAITLILTAFNSSDLVLKYKGYLAESIITNKKFNLNLYKLLKERFTSIYFPSIDVMVKDNDVFGSAIGDFVTKRVVSHEYWCNMPGSCNQISKKILQAFGLTRKFSDTEKYYELLACASLAEVEIVREEAYTFIIPLQYVEDLYSGCQKYKNFWVSKGIIDSNGNFLL
ncbi:hypothetical protein EDEG_03955 [Edhazardia aedis USNM 41457]|uniref:Uncharacterized protein n=1 Tax=Edhazardia aedis (strain USNM 41457) TaxID=1003232 RepID=J9DJ61_EDHAE|nr:hypothetical protein EDEG_03955 [Edhazardia aedis USNM 41457]|eukprot:EJW01422.1 hypothetical protein EDEG_03955 [Edhazardia aedis USNM 41457]